MFIRHALISLSLLVTSTRCVEMDVQLDRFEQTTGFDLINLTGVRVKKFNRSTWIFDGEFEFMQDIGDEYLYTMTAAYSRMGNNQFNEYPMKIQRAGFCQVMNGQYKEYQEYFLKWTNMPRVGDEWLCPYPKGKYWVRQFAPEAGWIPPVVPEGYWRLTGDFIGPDGENAVKYVTYLRVVRKLI